MSIESIFLIFYVVVFYLRILYENRFYFGRALPPPSERLSPVPVLPVPPMVQGWDTVGESALVNGHRISVRRKDLEAEDGCQDPNFFDDDYSIAASTGAALRACAYLCELCRLCGAARSGVRARAAAVALSRCRAVVLLRSRAVRP